MKVALIGRSTLFKVKGGDTIQMVKTAEGLNGLGVKANIYLATDRIDYQEFDLLHFFNVIRPADHLWHIRHSKKPYVVSTIFLDYSGFDRKGRNAPFRTIFRMVGSSGAEYLKNIYRFTRKQDILVSREYLLGHRRALLNVIEGAALILPNSQSEFRRVRTHTGYKGKYEVIPNGIDLNIFGQIPVETKREEKVVCVAQVYGMKNQHSLIQACAKLKADAFQLYV